VIEVFVVEEHNEAFFVWNYARQKGLIPDRLNTLLHVDYHADMHLPLLETSITKLDENLANALSFAQNQLSISDFILPAVYQGLFNEIYWMHQDRKMPDKEQHLNVFSHQGDGHNLFVTDNFLQAGIFNPDRRCAVFRQIDHNDSISPSGRIILDIDLDYFGCDTGSGETWEVEVAEDEYRRFFGEPRHRLRMKFGGKIQAQTRDGKHFFVYRPNPLHNQPSLEPDKIAERIDRFVDWLEKNKITPALIDICRSRFSGYAPATQWRQMEEHLLERLGALFPVNVRNLKTLTENEAL
jgi:hypothetical protein